LNEDDSGATGPGDGFQGAYEGSSHTLQPVGFFDGQVVDTEFATFLLEYHQFASGEAADSAGAMQRRQHPETLRFQVPSEIAAR
jgi:hypothetical protein